MNESDDLMYSSEASATRFLYYQGLNEINLFVEDAGMEYEYESIFKRLLNDKFCISTIFALGGKPKVKERFLEFGVATDGIKNYYIVDGDFDRYIKPDEMIVDTCFIYLKTYNIENYFLDEAACVQFAKGRLKCLDSEAKRKVGFPTWKRNIVSQAAKLFLCYCFIQKYYPQVATLSRSSYLFIDSTTGFEKAKAYQQYWATVISLDKEAERKIAEISANYKAINGDNYFNLICGKFLFDSLYCHLRNIIGCKFEKGDLRWYLLNHFDVTQLDYIKNAILMNDVA